MNSQCATCKEKGDGDRKGRELQYGQRKFYAGTPEPLEVVSWDGDDRKNATYVHRELVEKDPSEEG